MKQNYLIIGSPGSGKGTLCEILKAKGYHIIAMGERLRYEIKIQSTLGQKIKHNVDSGILIPDDLAFSIISQEILKSPKPFAIEGFPSTKEQFKLFLMFLKQHDLIETMTAVLLDCPEETALARICERLICNTCASIYNRSSKPSRQENRCDRCEGILIHRPEDTIECARNRIQTYCEKTLPIVDAASQTFLIKRINTSTEWVL